MMEFISKYSAEIITILSILIAITPAFIKRTISDKRLIKKFGDIKSWSKDLDAQQLNLEGTVKGLDALIIKIEKDIDQKLESIDKAILEFKEDELYQRLSEGLAKINELEEIVNEKDNLIESYRAELKAVNNRLTKLEQLEKS